MKPGGGIAFLLFPENASGVRNERLEGFCALDRRARRCDYHFILKSATWFKNEDATARQDALEAGRFDRRGAAGQGRLGAATPP